MIRRRLVAALLLIVAVGPAPALAHPVPFSFLDLRLQSGPFQGTLVVHILDVAHDLGIEPAGQLLDPAFAARSFDAVVKLLSGRLRIAIDGVATPIEWTRLEVAAERHSLRLSLRLPLSGSARIGSMQVSGTLFPYDANHRTFLNVYQGETLTQAILDRSHPSFEYFAGTRQGALAVVRKFLPSGIHHILIGPDHLLFLIGLLLLGGTLGRLLLIVTGFTIAHSITLSLAALGIVTPPATVIEPAIALSIVFVRPWIALVFGLVHGFGFASVLREMDLPARALGWSLFSFNIGVEIGQLLVVTAAAAVLETVRRWNPDASRRIAVAGSLAVIAAGGFWFVQRVFLSGGLQ